MKNRRTRSVFTAFLQELDAIVCVAALSLLAMGRASASPQPTILEGRMHRKCLHLVLLFLLAAMSAMAQQTSIVGQVTDSSGAAVVGAKVTATRVGGGSIYNTETNASGNFQLPVVTAADYTVRAEFTGFAPAEQRLSLLVGQTAELNLKLQPASATTSVSVNAEVSVEVDTVSSQIAGNIDPGATQQLPLNGRNWMQLAEMVPGIRVNTISVIPLGTVSYGAYNINVDGQQVTQNAGSSSSGDPLFSRDAISQFQIITNRFDATMGRSDQIQISAETKSGADQIHGTAFGYFRNDAFDASDPIARKVLPFSDQQYGGGEDGEQPVHCQSLNGVGVPGDAIDEIPDRRPRMERQ